MHSLRTLEKLNQQAVDAATKKAPQPQPAAPQPVKELPKQ